MYYICALMISILLCELLQKYSVRIGNFHTKNHVYLGMFLSFLPLFFLAAFRWDLGVDTIYATGHYSAGYRLASVGRNDINYAVGFFKFFELFASNGIPLFWCYFTITCMYFCAIFYLIKKLRLDLFWTVVTFFGIDLYIFSFSAVRQSLAFVFIFVALAVFFQDEKRNYLKTFLLLVLATSIHYTCIIYFGLILLDFLVRKKKFVGFKRATVFNFMVGGVVLSPLMYYMAKKFILSNFYLGGLVLTKFTPSYLVFSAFFLWIGYQYWKGIVKQNPKYSILVVAMVALFFLTVLSPVIYHMDRVFHLFCPIFLIYIPVLWKSIAVQTERYMIFLMIVVIMMYLIKAYFIPIPGSLDYEAFGTYHSVFENWDYYTTLGKY